MVGQGYRRVGAVPPSAGWVAVLNSRQGRYPQCGEEWVKATVAAVRRAAAQGKGIITSVGLPIWGLSLWAAGDCGAHAAVVLPSYEGERDETLERIGQDFGLKCDRLTCFFFDSPHGPHRRKAGWPERDRLVAMIAGEVWPISVRPGGNLERLIDQALREGKPVIEECRVAYRPLRGSAVRRIETTQLAAWTRPVDWPYLTHWTRSFGGPWPGEREADYYLDLSREGNGNPRAALETLGRILLEGRLRGSSFRMPGQRRAVAFTELSPALALEQMRYRKRFQRWSFEPYGLALDGRKLDSLGARPVIYTSDPPKEPDLFVQGQRSGRADWSGQCEWRIPGDLDMSRFESSEGLVIVRDAADRKRIEPMSRWPVLALTESSGQ